MELTKQDLICKIEVAQIHTCVHVYVQHVFMYMNTYTQSHSAASVFEGEDVKTMFAV